MSLINREDLIAEYDRVHVGKPGGARKLMVDAPEVQPEPKWISCKECLPEIGDYVICSQENGDVGEGKLLPDGNWLILYESAVYGIRWVTAWMPLPEPYREEGETDVLR